MALHDSALADAPLRALALRALCAAAVAPELAADLVLRAGARPRRAHATRLTLTCAFGACTPVPAMPKGRAWPAAASGGQLVARHALQS
jgi:hypothetical protein